MPLNSNAIIDVETYKQFINIKDSDTSNDEKYELFINSASQDFEDECRRKFRQPQSAIIETIDGNGLAKMRLRYWPITDPPTEIKYYDGGSDTYVALTSPIFQINTDKGIITFMDGNIWRKGNRNWQVTYNYGYTQDDIPANLQRACAEHAKYHQNIFADNLQGISSISHDGGTVSYVTGQSGILFTSTVWATIKRYRSFRRVISG
jgi:hypothetical protein